MPTLSPNLGLFLGVEGGDEDDWGEYLNSNWTYVDGALGAATDALSIDLQASNWKIAGVSVTSTASEINLLDGVTWTLTDFNGLTATVTELNYSDGVTSNIQNQLDSKAPLSSPSFVGNPTAPTAGVGTDSTQIATTAYVKDQVLDEDDMASNNAFRPPSQQSVAAYVQAEREWDTVGPNVTTSGTSVTLTGIPTGVSQVQVIFNQISQTGSDNILIQLSTGGGFVTTGYSSYAADSGSFSVSSTDGFIVYYAAAARNMTGIMTLQRIPGQNAWISSHTIADTVDQVSNGGGVTSTALSGQLDQIRIITVGGTNAFDNGSISIRYL